MSSTKPTITRKALVLCLFWCLATAGALSAAKGREGYVIQPRDTLRVTVWGHEDLDLSLTVTYDGEINFPLIGAVKVEGLTLEEARKRITELLARDYLVKPTVFVKVESTGESIYVLGMVQNPGRQDYVQGLTSLNACIKAGGFTRLAASGRTRILRTTDGKTRIIHVDLEDVAAGKSEDVKLMPGDRIEVPERMF